MASPLASANQQKIEGSKLVTQQPTRTTQGNNAITSPQKLIAFAIVST